MAGRRLSESSVQPRDLRAIPSSARGFPAASADRRVAGASRARDHAPHDRGLRADRRRKPDPLSIPRAPLLQSAARGERRPVVPRGVPKRHGACMRHSTAPHPRHLVDAAPSGPQRTALRLLVTNPWNGQAYCVLRALRPYATRVIVTTYREHGILGRLAPAAVSRFVDGVYPVPFAAQDWQLGRIPTRTRRRGGVRSGDPGHLRAGGHRHRLPLVGPRGGNPLEEQAPLHRTRHHSAGSGVARPSASDGQARAGRARREDRVPVPSNVPTADPRRCCRRGRAGRVPAAAEASLLVGLPGQLASTTPPWTARVASSARSCTATSGPCSPRSRRSPPPRSRSRSPR